MYGSSQNSFADLMSIARHNADEAKKKAANIHLLPETGKPKRADPRQVKLKEGVAKFLAKKDEEDRRRKEQEKVKKEQLMQLRQQDRKAANRVRKMLSMTKSANKSCMEEANDCLNTAVAAQGEFQPDEDDYGYTSNYAEMMHKKMMEKYKTIPVKPAFPQERNAVPVPRHQSLSKNSGTSWRKSGSSQDYEEERGYSSPEQDRYEEPAPRSHNRKPEKPSKPNRPPPPDYRLLLQMAQEKQLEPAIPIKPVIEKKGEMDEFEFGRPMTAKEKKVYLEQKEWKDRVARRMEGKSDNNNNSSGSGPSSNDNKNGKMPSFKIPRARSNIEEGPSTSVSPAKRTKVSDPEPSPSSSSSSSRSMKESPKLAARLTDPVRNGNSFKSSPPQNGRPNGIRPSSSASNGPPPRPIEKSQKQSSLSSSSSPSQSFKSRDDYSRDRPPATSRDPPRSDNRPDKIIQERKELIKEKPRYLSAFEGGKEKERERERDRDYQRKQPLLSKDSNKPRPGSSRDVYSSSREERNYDSRDKVRASPAPKMSQQEHNDRNRQQPKGREREDIRTPPSRRDMAPPPRKDMGPAPRRDVGPSPRRDVGPSPRRDMGPSPRRDMPPQSRRDMGPPPRRDMPMKSHPRMRDESPPRMRPSSKPAYRGRAVIDSDDEYDSEMDDFIDDSEVDMGNISAEISKIFKYDRRKYAGYDESDDECMESSVAEQLMEERRSLRIGIKEDLEDMAREEEEKKRMKMKMMKKRR